jgi:hypothetical protein
MAHKTAALGVRTRVETTVAIEFAASFIPFMKSKPRAMTIQSITIISIYQSAIRRI